MSKLLPAAIVLLLVVWTSVNFFPVSDEIPWVKGGKDFGQAIIELRPDRTYVTEVSHRLGVTVLWISALIHLTATTSLPFETLIMIHRACFLLINLLLFGLSLALLRRHVSEKVLLLLVLYLSLNRFFPIMARSTWLDQLLTSLGFLTIVLWVRFLTEGKRIYLIGAGFFNGLIMLTKYAGWYFPLIVAGLSYLYYYRQQKSFKQIIQPLLVFLGLSLVVMILLYPKLWVDPKTALLFRFGDHSIPDAKIVDIWDYLKELRLVEPTLILGLILVICDWLKKRRDGLYFIGLAGGLYLTLYILTVIGLSIFGRLNFSFLEGIYRYTFPAIPLLALYTFVRLPDYLANRKLYWTLIMILFFREIVFSPLLLF